MQALPTRRRAPATIAEVNSYRDPGRYSVGDGLLLVVQPSGSRSWIARVRDPSGRRRDIGLGRYPEVSLKEAREKAAEHRRIARDDRDPVAEKRKARAATTKVLTFREAARRAYDERKPGLKNAKHSWQWFRTLEMYAFPTLGDEPVGAITKDMVARAIKPIWLSKPETARRTLHRIGVVIEWAEVEGLREHTVDTRAIGRKLPKQPKGVEHLAAVAYADAPRVFTALVDQPETMARLCLQFIILTGVRSGEGRGARWSEVDMDARLWTIPAGRMKMAKEHSVPLSDAAMAILRPLHDARSGDVVFPGNVTKRSKAKGEPILSDVALTKAQKLVAPETTVHGWRSTLRDWGAEETSFSGEVLEKALAHQVANAVERAYRRGDLLEKRRQLMQAWDNFLYARSADVVALRGAA